MTANTKTLEAIRLLRDEASGAENSDWETMCGVLASALEESLQPPAEKRVEAGGEAPEPLPEVLPVGTQRVVAGFRETSASTLELERNSFGEPRYRGYSWSGLTRPEDIDWAHYRLTHSPPPSREGEALPGVADAEELRRLTLALENQRNVTGDAVRMYDEQKQRAEAAEARLAELEERHDVERETWHATNVRHAGELEAARARVGELESAARLECVLSLEQAARFLQSFAEAVGQPCADAERWDFDASARHMMMCLGVRAHVVPHATDPAPSAPTPAVVEKPRQQVRHWCRPCGDVVTVHEGGCCSQCGSYETERQTKESPPRDSGGEKAARVTAGTQRFAVGERVESIAEPRLTGTVKWCGTGAGACVGVEDDADGLEADFNVEAVRLVAEGDYRRELERKKGPPDEQREGQEAPPPAETASGQTTEAGSAVGIVATDGLGGGVPGDRERSEEVAPPGLTPEDAEAGARRMYEAQTTTGPWIQWEELQDETREVMIADYRFAHSEGAKAAKAEGGKVMAELLAKARDAARGGFNSDVCVNIVRELAALATDLEGAK